jgi:hypothetical protein
MTSNDRANQRGLPGSEAVGVHLAGLLRLANGFVETRHEVLRAHQKGRKQLEEEVLSWKG